MWVVEALEAAEFSGAQFWAVAATEAINQLVGLFTVDCDGPVAIQALEFTGNRLVQLTARGGGVHTEGQDPLLPRRSIPNRDDLEGVRSYQCCGAYEPAGHVPSRRPRLVQRDRIRSAGGN
jgi:hypothetical protein